MKKEKQILSEINIGIEFSNRNRVWKAIGDLEDLNKKELQEKVMKEIDEIDFSITGHSLGIPHIPDDWQDKHNKEVKIIIKQNLNKLFEEKEPKCKCGHLK